MIASETTMLSSNGLKIRLSCKRVEAVHGKRTESDHSKVPRDFRSTVSVVHDFNSAAKSSLPGSQKRGPSEDIEAQREKKMKVDCNLKVHGSTAKMDRHMKVQCRTILRSLMSGQGNWVFCKPVDPVALKIPDYFDVISSPMDLGTIKSKLEDNRYSAAKEFADDVRLTFSNCMLYNPPGNYFHEFAKKLNKDFEKKWSLVEEKRNEATSEVDESKYSSVQIKKIKEIADSRQNLPDSTPSCNGIVIRRSVPSKEKVGNACGASNGEGDRAKTTKNCTPKLGKNHIGGNDSGGRQSSCSRSAKQPSSLVSSRCSTCGNNACRCSLHTDSNQLSSSDISSDRSSSRDRPLSISRVTKVDCQAKSSSTSQMSKSDPESDGAVSALDEENICPSSQLTTPVIDATSGEAWSTPIFDVPLSPKKALRAAMLKSRFADTILKAQQKSIQNQGDRRDPVNLQQERERLERRQREEKARIEAEIRAAQAAAEKQAELELKERKEREREEARIALETMERTVEFEQNCEILEELKRLAGYHSGTWGSHFRSPLERLGLFIKEDCAVEVDELDEGEEGEIL